MAIEFFKPNNEYFCFSNFSRHPVVVDGLTYPTSEHYYQSMKFSDINPERAEKIRNAASPREAADMGRNSMYQMRPDWNEIKDEVMRRVVLIKAQSHPKIKEILLSTGDEEIVESSPKDDYWGSGANGTGKNMLGKIWMEVRAILRAS